MRNRTALMLVGVMLLASTACSGSDVQNTGSGTTTADGSETTARPSYCDGATLTAPEVGVTPDTITLTVMADTGSPIRPGLFQGSVDGAKAWADYVNDKGGLACRKVVVKEYDSKLSVTDARDGVAQACSDSLAMIGTTALFLQDVSTLDNCKDKAGNDSGLPDFAQLQTEPSHQCAATSFALPAFQRFECPYTSGLRDYKISAVPTDYVEKSLNDTSMHGVFLIPKDLPSSISAVMPAIRATNKEGIASDAEFGVSGLFIQSDYTPFVQTIIRDKSTYVRSLSDYASTVMLRKEAQNQGATSVKVWDCGLQCYDQRLISEGGDAVEGQWVWMAFLPLEDADSPAVKAFRRYDKKPDGFGIQSWIMGEAFARAVNDAIAANGNDPNAITRPDILTATRAMKNFDAGGFVAPVDFGKHEPSYCMVGMQVRNGKFVRVAPTKPGTFLCPEGRGPTEVTINPVAEYKG